MPALGILPAQRPPLLPLALFTVARPRARPTPLPLVPRDRNMGAFLRLELVCVSKPGLRLPLPQHVWNNEIADVRATNIDLFEMRYAAVAGGNRNVLELDVHVVLG